MVRLRVGPYWAQFTHHIRRLAIERKEELTVKVAECLATSRAQKVCLRLTLLIADLINRAQRVFFSVTLRLKLANLRNIIF